MKSTIFTAGLLCVLALTQTATSQTRIMPLGDSITQGGQTFASYRYELWYDLEAAGYAVDFVGGQQNLNANSIPDALAYPEYFTTFDRDHEGYWGWRTDQIESIALGIANAAIPDVVLLHLGTNDIGQMGAAGVANADANLRLIIGHLRSAVPNVTILLAQVIGIGPGSSYFANEAQVAPLNAALATIAGDLDTGQSPIILVDQNTPFNLATMVQGDGLHPNVAGESQMASVWLGALSNLLTAGNIPPTTQVTLPTNGSSFTAGANIAIEATASDVDGFVVDVRFFANGAPLGNDTSDPYELSWNGVSAGNYDITTEAEDDSGAVRTSLPVSISVLPPGGGAIAVSNASFETPVLIDGDLATGPGTFDGWEFTATPITFLGIFNPPSGSYSTAGGNASPSGADGANVAFLFNDGGPTESVVATQVLGEVLTAGQEYVLTVAIGRFLANQPYSFSTYGGYVLELLAGATVIASDTDTVDPAFDEFQDAFCMALSDDFPTLLGQPLSIRLGISDNVEDRSTHFDNVRLTRRDLLTSSPPARRRGRVAIAPNPFNPRTTIAITLGHAQAVDLFVYDVAGRRVQTIFERRPLPAGVSSIPYQPRSPSGVYYLRARGAGWETTKKLVLVR